MSGKDLLVRISATMMMCLPLFSLLIITVSRYLPARILFSNSAVCGKPDKCGHICTGFSSNAVFSSVCGYSPTWINGTGGTIFGENSIFVNGGAEIIRSEKRFLYRSLGVSRLVEITDLFGMASILRGDGIIGDIGKKVINEPKRAKPKEAKAFNISVPGGDLSAVRGAPEGDRIDIREYCHGDSARFILWKVIARTGGRRTYVRTPEISEAERPDIGVFFIAGDNDDASAELARYIVEENILKGRGKKKCLFSTSTQLSYGSTKKTSFSTKVQIIEDLAESGNFWEKPALHDVYQRLGRFIAEARRNGIRYCMVILPDDDKLFGETKDFKKKIDGVKCGYFIGSRNYKAGDWAHGEVTRVSIGEASL